MSSKYLKRYLPIRLRLIKRSGRYLLIAFVAILIFSKYFEGSKLRKYTTRQNSPVLEIFSAPPPVTAENERILHRAISSWVSLDPKPKITLLGNSSGIRELAQNFRITHEQFIDTNFVGRPLFNSLVHRANQSTADITIFVNADVMILDDISKALRKLYDQLDHFMAIAARYDVENIPSTTDESHENIRKFVLKNGALHNQGGIDLWAWTTKGPRLIGPPIPPFVFARGKYDNWFVHEIIKYNKRPVVDISESAITVHTRHTYHNSVPIKAIALAMAPESAGGHNAKFNDTNFWSQGKSQNFELFLNIHLSLQRGSYKLGLGTPLHAPFKLVPCLENERLCLFARKRAGICYCEYSPTVQRTQVDPRLDHSGRPLTHSLSPGDENLRNFQIPVDVTRATARDPHFGLPLTLLDGIASVIRNSTVILTVATYEGRHMLMNWACFLRRIGKPNVLVAALDRDLYKFAIARGIAVYYEDSFENGVHVGEHGFKNISASEKRSLMFTLHIRVVLRVLRLGYDVLWSDLHTIFLQDPDTYISNLKGDLLIQSSAGNRVVANYQNQDDPTFFFSRSSAAVISFLNNFVQHRNVVSDEEMGFFVALCGANGELRRGTDKCVRDGILTRFLKKRVFKSSLSAGIWNSSTRRFLKYTRGFVTVHVGRQVLLSKGRNEWHHSPFWLFSRREDVCRYELLQGKLL